MTSTLTTRIDAQDNSAFEAFCKSAGMTPSTAVNIFIKATLREGEIPFKIKADPFYSEENMERLRKNMAEMESTGGTIHEVKIDG